MVFEEQYGRQIDVRQSRRSPKTDNESQSDAAKAKPPLEEHQQVNLQRKLILINGSVPDHSTVRQKLQ